MRFPAILLFASCIVCPIAGFSQGEDDHRAPLVGGSRGATTQHGAVHRKNRWKNELSSGNSQIRLEAIEDLVRLPATPPEAVLPLLGAARNELDTALKPPPPSDDGWPTGPIPLVGDEVSLERVKANAPDYLDKSFIVRGSVHLWDHYSYGYWGADRTHFALRFTPLGAAGALTGSETAVVYLLRERGRRLEEQVVRLAERGFEQTVVRLRATILSVRYKGPECWRQMEVLDWQLLNHETGTWGPWAFSGFDLCFVAIRNAGNDAVRPLVDLIVADPRDPMQVDRLMKATAVRSLSEIVNEHEAELDDVYEAFHDVGRATEEVEVQDRVALALAAIDQICQTHRIDESRRPIHGDHER